MGHEARISLPEEDVTFLDVDVRERGLASHSATIQESRGAPLRGGDPSHRRGDESARPVYPDTKPARGDPVPTVADRPGTAVLVIDVQKGVMAAAHERDRVVANVATLVERARASGTPVIWVQHASDGELPHGSDAWQLVPELVPADGEHIVHKTHCDSFAGTDLQQTLRREGIGRLVVAGAQTDACIRSTIHAAFTRGYDVTLVADAHTTEDLTAYGAPLPEQVIAHTNLTWQWQSAPGRQGAVVATADVELGSS